MDFYCLGGKNPAGGPFLGPMNAASAPSGGKGKGDGTIGLLSGTEQKTEEMKATAAANGGKML